MVIQSTELQMIRRLIYFKENQRNQKIFGPLARLAQAPDEFVVFFQDLS